MSNSRTLSDFNNTLVAKTSTTGAALIPSGTTAERPVSPLSGMIRDNTTIGSFEIYRDGTWTSIKLTAAEVASLYEGVADKNAFTDAEKAKLDNIEPNATTDQSGPEIKTLYEAELNAFTDAQFTKLANIEDNSTADQTGPEIKAAYEAQANTNAFTDIEKTKLAGIEPGATVGGSSAATDNKALVYAIALG